MILLLLASTFMCASIKEEPSGQADNRKNDVKKEETVPLQNQTVSPPVESDKVREERILDNYSESKKEQYAELLVPLERYTTGGGAYQQKYHKYLIAIAGDIIEQAGLKVSKGSIGFYYDRKSNDKTRLYLGLDIDTGETSEREYAAAAVNFIRRDMRRLLHSINSCRSVFHEKEIAGMVVGWKWKARGFNEQVNIWILKEDVISFEKNTLTFDGLFQRSTVTNTDGKIIRLKL
jgi:hypothetical protein